MNTSDLRIKVIVDGKEAVNEFMHAERMCGAYVVVGRVFPEKREVMVEVYRCTCSGCDVHNR